MFNDFVSKNVGLLYDSSLSRCRFFIVSLHVSHTWLCFCRYTARTPLLSAIDGIAYHGGEYYDLPPEFKIRTQIFNRQKGRQRNRFLRNVVVVITDGAPNVNKTNAEAIGAEHQKNGIAVFVVCVTTGCSEDWGKALAAKPNKVRKLNRRPMLSVGEEEVHGFSFDALMVVICSCLDVLKIHNNLK